MITLTPNESRVLGVLVEKAQTTPQQYPLTLNAMVSGSNQKNNRDPVTNLTDENALEALDGLRSKGLAREVMLSGSRVEKFRHIAREALEVTTSELVILAELLLRGPQTIGELRGRASRMHPLETSEIVKNILDSLMGRPEPFVRELPPIPGSGDRAARYAQLLCPDLHPLDGPAPAASSRLASAGASPMPAQSLSEILQRLERLEADVAQLKSMLAAPSGTASRSVHAEALSRAD